MGIDFVRLSKTVSMILRHEPDLYELEPDNEGWVDANQLLSALHTNFKHFSDINTGALQEMVRTSSKNRYEMNDTKIRALYGHSFPGKLIKKQDSPPAVLYHGTSPDNLEKIKTTGLLPMGRQYVHLSTVTDMAKSVGSRKSKSPVILVIDAKKADENGVKFYIGNEKVWLADHIPGEFIEIME